MSFSSNSPTDNTYNKLTLNIGAAAIDAAHGSLWLASGSFERSVCAVMKNFYNCLILKSKSKLNSKERNK